MECRHCGVNILLTLDSQKTYASENDEEYEEGWRIGHGFCPNCSGLIVVKNQGEVGFNASDGSVYLETIDYTEILYPPTVKYKEIPAEVPAPHAKDLKEARDVLKTSRKASAALSRRILYHILEEVLEIHASTLSKQIDEFILRNNVPSYLSEEIDAIRNVGNFAAHPSKDLSTGEIVEVEEGEAEWLLEVLDLLFDFVFVQPKRHEHRTKQLNEKLKKIGKRPMKDG